MAFEKLELYTAPADKTLPASMSLSKRGTRPAGKLSLLPEFATEAGYKAKARYDILIGKGEDAGKLRIVAADKGRIVAHTVERSGGLIFHLGYVAAIGTKAHKRVRTEARIVSPGCVEIDVPDFGSAIDEQEPPASPAKRPDESTGTTAANGGGAPKADGAKAINGIFIDLTQDDESVTFRGKSTEVTTRQAKFVSLLARPRPQPVGESFLIGALWDGKPPANAKDQLKQMADNLQKGLSPIGLDLRTVKGVGYQLKDL